MRAISYQRAGSIGEAVSAAQAAPGALFLAGGTTLVDLLRERVFAPPGVIDIGRLPLRAIRLDGPFLRLGAMASNSEVAWHPEVQRHFPAVSEALLAGASPQIRNMASVGGNLLQRTRCPYFRDLSAPCNKRERGSGCAAWNGYNRGHAILGGGPDCIAAHASDFAVPLIAFGAVLRLRGSEGERDVPLSGFYLRPGDTPDRENTLRAGELIVEVRLPRSPAASHSLYRKIRDRQSFEFALCSVAAGAAVENGAIRDVKLALGGVGTVPWRAEPAEAMLVGKAPDAALFEKAADAALVDAQARAHNGFKVELARRVMVGALEEVCRA